MTSTKVITKAKDGTNNGLRLRKPCYGASSFVPKTNTATNTMSVTIPVIVRTMNRLSEAAPLMI